MIIMLLGACSIGGSENDNEEVMGVLSEMKEMDEKLGNDEEDEIDYNDTAENEVLIDLALEEFKEESENMHEFSNTEFSTLSIDDMRSATDIKTWLDKYIYIKVKAENVVSEGRTESFERYYKYEDGELIDSECYKDSYSGCNDLILRSEEKNLRNDTPDYEEENDNVLDLTRIYD
ncbi:hypothetical protein [Oceanobacillus oncorhynchi]|uniref:hypothetical protein n=1 Tax=Oceanobacillus oncorhynchi TaxID=545501 RepID=UPI0034D66758